MGGSMSQLIITSPAFQPNQRIPAKYSGEGEDINPPLNIEGIPEGTKSLALILEDPDAPSGTFDHWVAWNISPSQNEITENTTLGVQGLNSGRQHGYTGPYPPPGKPHRYIFRVFALDMELGLGANSTKKDLEKAMKGHALAEGKLIGLFSR
jgi:Raf kinase inhibitor-like YbhB/YbcL family protein